MVHSRAVVRHEDQRHSLVLSEPAIRKTNPARLYVLGRCRNVRMRHGRSPGRTSTRRWPLTAGTSCFKQEPNAALGLVDPILKQTRTRNVAVFVAQIMRLRRMQACFWKVCSEMSNVK